MSPCTSTNSNAVLQEQVSRQEVLKTVTLSVHTPPAGGIVNIPFITQHADCRSLSSVFWIETVDSGQGGSYTMVKQ